jgi:hypothetical protein
MSLGDRFRRRARAFRARLTVELVRLPELPAPPPRAALPAPERPRRRSAGLASLYGPTLDPLADPYQANPRPRPLGRGQYDPRPLIRDQASAWRDGGPDVSAYPLDRDALHAELFPLTVPCWEQRDQ